jgi:hypothetical protein
MSLALLPLKIAVHRIGSGKVRHPHVPIADGAIFNLAN